MIERFWTKFSINLMAIGLPALASVLGISLLVRLSDDAAAGIIMWTWFLMGSAAALNAGLHPSLTNDLGQTSPETKEWTNLVAEYVGASNIIYLSIALLAILWAIGNSQSGGLGTALFQVILLWLTGISSLLMTALNFNGHSDLTAKNKIFYNTLVFVLPVTVAALDGAVELSLLALVILKLIQTRNLFNLTGRLMNQSFRNLSRTALAFATLFGILRRHWRMVIISISQMSFSVIDRTVVVSFFGVAAYKSYGAILDIMSLVWLVASIFIILIHPFFSSGLGNSIVKWRTTASYSIWLTCLGGSGLLLVYFNFDLFLDLMLNIKSTDELDIIIRNLVAGFMISLTYILMNTLFIATGRQTRVLAISLVSLVSYSMLVVPVVSRFGLVGLSYLFLLKFTFEAFCFHFCFMSDFFRRPRFV